MLFLLSFSVALAGSGDLIELRANGPLFRSPNGVNIEGQFRGTVSSQNSWMNGTLELYNSGDLRKKIKCQSSSKVRYQFKEIDWDGNIREEATPTSFDEPNNGDKKIHAIEFKSIEMDCADNFQRDIEGIIFLISGSLTLTKTWVQLRDQVVSYSGMVMTYPIGNWKQTVTGKISVILEPVY